MRALLASLVIIYAATCMALCTIRWMQKLLAALALDEASKKLLRESKAITRESKRLEHEMRRIIRSDHGSVMLVPETTVSQRPVPQPPRPLSDSEVISRLGPTLGHAEIPPASKRPPVPPLPPHDVDEWRPGLKIPVHWYYDPPPNDCKHEWEEVEVSNARGARMTLDRWCRLCQRPDTRGSWQPTS
jgi:hypothetical protein